MLKSFINKKNSKKSKSKHHHHHHHHRHHHHHKKYEFIPEKNLLLVKVSHVNEAMVDFKAEIYDDQDDKECHFVRILRVGPNVKDPIATAPGTLVIVHKEAGKYLDILSKNYAEEYYLLSETDILAYVDM